MTDEKRILHSQPPSPFPGVEAHEKAWLEAARWQLLIESVRDYAIFMLDPQGRIVSWNPGAERIKGYRAEEIIGQHYSRFYTPEDTQIGRPAAHLKRAAEEGRVEHEGWRVRKDGSRFWANVVIAAIRDSSGRHIGFAKVTRDLTERRRQEEERLALAQAQEAIHLRDEFLSIASHELKTPLTSLQLQLQSMLEQGEQLGQRMRSRLDRAVRSAERLSELVETLLDVSRITSGHFQLSPQRFDLAEAVRDSAERLREAAGHAGCQLIIRADHPTVGTWDRLRMEQVVINLVANAIKYAAQAPIEVSLGQQGETVVLEVRDRGPGLPEGALTRIFERFERAAEVRHYGGMGLGLYVVREIIKAHDGMVTAHNLPEGGACFTVRLPLASRARAPVEPAKAEEPR